MNVDSPEKENLKKDTPTASAATTIITAENLGAQEADRGDVSAITIARMMGLATMGEFKVVESKVELLLTRLNAMSLKMEKISVLMNGFPTGADLERIDIQIGALRQMIREVLGGVASEQQGGADAAKKPGSKIVSNQPAEEVKSE